MGDGACELVAERVLHDHVVVTSEASFARLCGDPETKAYVERRTKEGKQDRFIIRCLKRHVATSIVELLPRPEAPLTT